MKRLSALFGLLIVTGCGSLTVQVSVLKPQVVEEETDRLILRRGLPGVLAQPEAMVANEYNDLATLHIKVLTKLAQQYDKQNDPTAALAAQSLRTKEGTLGKTYATERDEALRLIGKIREASAGNRTNEAASLVWQLQKRQANFLHEIRRGMDSVVAKAQGDLLTIPAEVNAEVAQHVSGSDHLLIGDGNITQQPAAYVIANARDQDKVWAPIFDRSYGAGQWGKTDVAIKMETRGVFTIKGLTFDASQTARIASKVGSQALLLGTQLAGVPIKTGTFTGDGAALASSSGALQTAEDQNATAEAKVEDKQDALIELATQILAQRVNIDSGAVDKMKAAITAIDAKFTSTKTRLSAN